MTTQRFQVIFEAHTNRFRASMRALRRDIDGFASRVGRLGVRGGLLGTAIGGGALALGGVGLSRTIDKLSTFTQLANRVRTTPGVVQILDRLAKVRGVEVDSLVETVEELQRTIGEGKFDLFEKMGLSRERVMAVKNDVLGLFGLFVDRLGTMPLADAIAAGGPIVGEDVTRNLVNMGRRELAEQYRLVRNPTPDMFIGESVTGALNRYRDQIQRVGGDLGISTREVEALRENWTRIVDTVELFGLKLAERAMPNLKVIADEVERWVRAQGGLDTLATNLVDRFESMVGKTEDIITGIHGMTTGIVTFGEKASQALGLGGRIASDVGSFLGRNLGTAQGRQGMLDTVAGDANSTVQAIARALVTATRDTMLDGFSNALRDLIQPTEEIARNTRNQAARAQ